MLKGFKPIYDEKSKILILGSFPSKKSLEEKFYYSHKQNQFWKILGDIFKVNLKEKTVEEKKLFLLKNNIALWDVFKKVEREGIKDSNIKNYELNDFKIFKNKNIKAVFYNGKTAYKQKKEVEKIIKTKHYYLPSTSPLHTKKYNEKLKEWSKIKKYLK